MDSRLVDALVENGTDLVRSQVILALYEGRDEEAREWWERMQANGDSPALAEPGATIEVRDSPARRGAALGQSLGTVPPGRHWRKGEPMESPAHLGRERRCARCGMVKGVTGFQKGLEVCRKCQLKGKGNGKQKKQKKEEEITGETPVLRAKLDPGLKMVRCGKCGKWSPAGKAVEGVCEKCRSREK